MKSWKPLLYLWLALSPIGAIGQTTDSIIVKAIKDPSAPANSAKADVFIQDKKIIAPPTLHRVREKKCRRNPTK